jgi:hypothetical protein
MGKPLRAFIHEDGHIYVCYKCSLHFAHEKDILSKVF